MPSVLDTFSHLLLQLWTAPEYRGLTNHPMDTHEASQRRLQEVLVALAESFEPFDEAPAPQEVACEMMQRYVTRPGGTFDEDAFGDVLIQADIYGGGDWRARLVGATVEVLDAPTVSPVLPAMYKFLSEDIVPELGSSYLDWVRTRWMYWNGRERGDIDVERLTSDLDVLTTNPATRLPRLDIGSVGRFMAEIGLPCFFQVDRTVMPAMSLLLLETDPRRILRSFASAVISDHALLGPDDRPFFLSRRQMTARLHEQLIRMYVTDDIPFVGRGNRQATSDRLLVLRNYLNAAGMIHSQYFFA